METVLKNHKTLITLLGLWATPFFINHFKNVDKRRTIASKKISIFFTKGKKKEKEKAFKPCKGPNESTFEEKPLCTNSLNHYQVMVPLFLEGPQSYIRRKAFINEGPSKKESGLSPPLIAAA